jgi:pentatricopeptide repeat protein
LVSHRRFLIYGHGAGKLTTEDAHHLFDALLSQANPVPVRFLNAFLAALARAPAGREGPTLAVDLFNRVLLEEGGLQVAPLSVHTYGILMDCCCRARRPDLGLAIFRRLLRTGLKTDQITANTFLKCLCYTEQTDEAVNMLLHRMPDLGCVPDAFSYSFVLKGLCDNSRSQQALDLLQMVVKEEGACSLDVVVYNTVIHGLCNEGGVSKACNLFHGMMQQGVVPDAVTSIPISSSEANGELWLIHSFSHLGPTSRDGNVELVNLDCWTCGVVRSCSCSFYSWLLCLKKTKIYN